MKLFFLLCLLLSSVSAWSMDTFITKQYLEPHGLGFLKGERPFDAFYQSFDTTDLPESFDWRALGGVSPIKNQGSTGDCWAFASTAAFESQLLIHDKKSISLSEQYLNDCNTDGYNGTTGGDFPILDMQVSPGQVLESDYPFAERNQRCKKNVPLYGHLHSWGYVGNGNGSPSVNEIRAALVQYGPLVVDVAASGSFSSYGGGVLNRCGDRSIDHMVLIVGYDNAKKYWIVKNSWGQNWGENGFIRMDYGCDQIAETAAFVVYP